MSLVFLDFEASSLSPQSFPIEVGWAFLAGGSGSTLIRPSVGWIDWDETSERIHGLSRETLDRDGTPAPDVARKFREDFSSHTLVADSPKFDGYWLARLLAEAEEEPAFQIADYWQVVASGIAAALDNRSVLVAPHAVRESAYKALEGGRQAMRDWPHVRHRGEMDAIRLRVGYETAVAEAKRIAKAWQD